MKSISFNLMLFTVSVAIAAVPVAVNAASPQPSTEAAIKAENARWADAFKHGNYQSIGRLYTEGGTLLQPGGPRIVGAAAISKYFAQMYSGKKPDTVTFSNIEFYGDEKVVTEVSDSALRNSDGKLLSRDKQILIFIKEGNAWKLHRDMWNNNGSLKPGDQ